MLWDDKLPLIEHTIDQIAETTITARQLVSKYGFTLTVMFLANFDAPAPRRPPVIQIRRNDLDRVTEGEFQSRTRLNFQAYRELHAIVEPQIAPKSFTNHAIPTHTRLQMALRYMAQGPMYLSNCDIYGVSKSSMSRHINGVFEAVTAKVSLTVLALFQKVVV